jgi:membrane protein YqaA with SNARE-associated domain
MDTSLETLGLWGLLVSSFVSSTLLPGNSEVVLAAVLHQAPALKWPAIAVATVGNTLGGLTSYGVGRLFPKPHVGRAVDWLRRHGPAALLLSWLPVIGDALCVASGWLRQNVATATLFIAIGKFLRYWALAEGIAWFLG